MKIIVRQFVIPIRTILVNSVGISGGFGLVTVCILARRSLAKIFIARPHEWQQNGMIIYFLYPNKVLFFSRPEICRLLAIFFFLFVQLSCKVFSRDFCCCFNESTRCERGESSETRERSGACRYSRV